MQVSRGRGSIAYIFFYLGTKWVNITTEPRFTPGKGPPVPIVQEAGWASELVWIQRLE
jgi:hypothetical protein